MIAYLVSLAFSSITVLLMAVVLAADYFEYSELREYAVVFLETCGITSIVLSLFSYEWIWARVGGVVSLLLLIVSYSFF